MLLLAEAEERLRAGLRYLYCACAVGRSALKWIAILIAMHLTLKVSNLYSAKNNPVSNDW